MCVGAPRVPGRSVSGVAPAQSGARIRRQPPCPPDRSAVHRCPSAARTRARAAAHPWPTISATAWSAASPRAPISSVLLRGPTPGASAQPAPALPRKRTAPGRTDHARRGCDPRQHGHGDRRRRRAAARDGGGHTDRPLGQPEAERRSRAGDQRRLCLRRSHEHERLRGPRVQRRLAGGHERLHGAAADAAPARHPSKRGPSRQGGRERQGSQGCGCAEVRRLQQPRCRELRDLLGRLSQEGRSSEGSGRPEEDLPWRVGDLGVQPRLALILTIRTRIRRWFGCWLEPGHPRHHPWSRTCRKRKAKATRKNRRTSPMSSRRADR